MKLLIFEWAAGTFTYNDILESLEGRGVSCRTVSYQFDDKNEDPFFEDRFSRVLKEDEYDAVFSVNYFPLVAKCCEATGVKYVSWSYDNPLDVPDIEKTLGLSCNHVFLFDRIQAEGYRKKGFKNVYHMPLAVNCNRLDSIRLTASEQADYQTDIAFVGKMYDSMYGEYLSLMDDYCRGYVEAAADAQKKVYGYYMIDDLLNDAVMDRINTHFKELDSKTTFSLPREALSYAVAAQITKNDRITILHVLSKRYKLDLYSWDKNDLLIDVRYRGSCDYLTQMPKVFKAARINLNITLRILQSGIPLRALDILGAGGFLLSNWQSEIAENFTDGVDVVMYDSVEDAIEKAIYYLENEDLRQSIARSGHDRAKENFSYDRRLEQIFRMAGVNI